MEVVINKSSISTFNVPVTNSNYDLDSKDKQHYDNKSSNFNECTCFDLKLKQDYLTKTKNKVKFNQKYKKHENEYKLKLLSILSSKLESILNSNIREEKRFPQEFVIQNKSYFYSEEIPEISLYCYFKRLVELSEAETSTFVLLSIFVDRFCSSADFHLTWNTIFR